MRQFLLLGALATFAVTGLAIANTKTVQDENLVGKLATDLDIKTASAGHAGTRRLATIQRRLAEQFARFLPLKIVPAPIELPSLEETMQWHTQFAADPAIAWLRSEMRAAAARMTREHGATELSSRGPRRIRVS